MWPYFGSKSSIIKYYPVPEYGKIIEPFAGSASYSVKYWDRDILLVDKYDVITRLWQWLQTRTTDQIRNIRQLGVGQNVDDFEWEFEEEKWLIGFLVAASVTTPRKTPSEWKTILRPNTQEFLLNLIADNLFRIKHWDVQLEDYKDIPNQEATWFIDPPYVKAGHYYKYGSTDINYTELAVWCQSRKGQVIVCEQLGAGWLPFREITKTKGTKNKSTEVIWSNRPIMLQERMF